MKVTPSEFHQDMCFDSYCRTNSIENAYQG